MKTIIALLLCVSLYQNNLKNRDFDKKGSQNLHAERGTIAERQGQSENANSEINPTQSKTDSSSCFGIYGTSKESALLRSLNPLSLSEHLAFYELYPTTHEGKQALEKIGSLLGLPKNQEGLSLPPLEISPIIALVTKQPFDPPVELSQEHIRLVQALAAQFPNKKLKGSTLWNKEELLDLPSDEIDLARAILLHQFDTLDQVLQYETMLDLMALQIRAQLSLKATDLEKMHAINRFIFQEMQFRFPPHSLYASDIDLYTFLPSVLDSRQGVCLGVSILYLSLAQRLGLDLEIITPPGHIYLRYRLPNNEVINIETTARGIHLPSENYLGINTRNLAERSLKEVIGMAFFNQAASAWGKQDSIKTIALYEKALLYAPHDPLIKMLLGLNYLFAGKKKEALSLLTPLANLLLDHAVSPETIPADFLAGRADANALQAIFKTVDEKRSSILEKQKELQAVLKKFPQFRAGLFQLATTYLQLGRKKEAITLLEQYHQIDPKDATVEYYLSALSFEQQDIPHAWEYLKNAEAITAEREHHPVALKQLRQTLKTLSFPPL